MALTPHGSLCSASEHEQGQCSSCPASWQHASGQQHGACLLTTPMLWQYSMAITSCWKSRLASISGSAPFVLHAKSGVKSALQP